MNDRNKILLLALGLIPIPFVLMVGAGALRYCWNSVDMLPLMCTKDSLLFIILISFTSSHKSNNKLETFEDLFKLYAGFLGNMAYIMGFTYLILLFF